MKAGEIRRDSVNMVSLFEQAAPRFGNPSMRQWFLLAQSLVIAVQEVAAQLAELNERGGV
jgi:hypothetical protein